MSREPEREDALDPELAELLRLDDRPGPAVRIASRRASAMVDAALDGLAASTSPSRVIEETHDAPRSRASRPRWRVALLAAAAMFVLVGIAAAYWVTRDDGETDARSLSPLGGESAGRSAVPSTQPSPNDARSLSPLGGERAGRGADPSTPDVPSDARSLSPLGGERAGRSAAPSTPDVPSDARSLSPLGGERAGRGAAPSTPDDLLRDANRLRAARRWREAERTYARVLREHPRTSSAHVARIAAADIRLSHLGDPRGALRLYRSAVGGRGGGALALEARQGVAESYRRLGNIGEEARALRSIVASHPGTTAARRATRRLAEIESTP